MQRARIHRGSASAALTSRRDSIPRTSPTKMPFSKSKIVYDIIECLTSPSKTKELKKINLEFAQIPNEMQKVYKFIQSPIINYEKVPKSANARSASKRKIIYLSSHRGTTIMRKYQRK